MSKEIKKFDAEVDKILQLMIHSLYSNKDIFIRELISNSADACDKLRYMSQTNSTFLGEDNDFKINVIINKEKSLLTIKDNGIGMNKQDLMTNLGTIAHSGTQRFLKQLSGDVKKDNMLIGQFGVGFYSGFMVSDEITVISKKAGEDKAYKWHSNGNGEYSVEEYNEDFTRGTEVILHLKEDSSIYLDYFRTEHIIKSYSDHIAIPIFLNHEENTKQINSSSALWSRSKNEITKEQYQEFYKTISYSLDEPWVIIHNKNEGKVEFTNLLFIPSTKTFDLFHPDRKRRVKLYIKRVFISDENIDLVPHYMRFLRGVVDSEDLPLNISRETLQHNSVLEQIKSIITKKVIAELKNKKEENREDYIKFWGNFGAVLKEGLCEIIADSDSLLEICLFYSSIKEKMITLDEYIKDMQEGQKDIYYLTGDNIKSLILSPQIEGFKRNNIDVLLMTDPVDDFWVNVISKFKDFEIKSVSRSDIDLTNITKDEEIADIVKNEDDFIALINFFKEALGQAVKDVKISKKLTSSAACLVSDGMGMRLEKTLIAQNQLSKVTPKILEINPKHQIIQKIFSSLESNAVENLQLVNLIFDLACVQEGEELSDINAFVTRVNSILEKLN